MTSILEKNQYNWNDFIKLFSGEESLFLDNIDESDLIDIFNYVAKNFSDIYLTCLQSGKKTSVLLRYRNSSSSCNSCMLLKQGEESYKNGYYEESLECFNKLNSFQNIPSVYTYVMLTLVLSKMKNYNMASHSMKIAETIVNVSYLREESKEIESSDDEIFKYINKECLKSGKYADDILSIFYQERQDILSGQINQELNVINYQNNMLLIKK